LSLTVPGPCDTVQPTRQAVENLRKPAMMAKAEQGP
jgi:hypothetical protein